MEKKIIIKLVVVAVIAAGLGFYGGMTYAKGKGPASRAGFAQGGQFAQFGGPGGPQGGRGGFRGAGGPGGAGFVTGEILSKDATGITVKMRDGGSKIVITSAATTASKPTDIPLDSLTVGDNVMVVGKPNADGSVTAESIQVRPPGMPGTPGAGTNTNAPAPATK